MESKELLIQFHEEVPPAQSRRIIEELGCRVKEMIVPQRIFVVDCPTGAIPEELMEGFRKRTGVSHVEPNAEMELFDEGGGNNGFSE